MATSITILVPGNANQPTAFHCDSQTHTELTSKQIAQLTGIKQDSLKTSTPTCGRYYHTHQHDDTHICETVMSLQNEPQTQLKCVSVKQAKSLAHWRYRTFLAGVWLGAVSYTRDIFTYVSAKGCRTCDAIGVLWQVAS